MFSIAEYSGWKPAPTSSSAATRPLTSIVPASGARMRASIFSIVDLPEPLRPKMPSAWPVGTSNEMSSTAVNSSYTPRRPLSTVCLSVVSRLR